MAKKDNKETKDSKSKSSKKDNKKGNELVQPDLKVIHFKLGEKALKFETPDKKISLNRFTNTKTGSVSSDNFIAFNMVITALHAGVLIQIEDGEKDDSKDDIIDLNNVAADKNKLKSDAATFLKKLKKDLLLERIDKISDPKLIAVMIELESFGKNMSKRKREDIIISLKERLEVVQKDAKTRSTMVDYTEADKEKPVKYEPKV
jgi:hypothetical protein